MPRANSSLSRGSLVDISNVPSQAAPPRQKFDINSKKFFLTYPRCEISKEDALLALRRCVSPRVIERYCIGKENHQDGK